MKWRGILLADCLLKGSIFVVLNFLFTYTAFSQPILAENQEVAELLFDAQPHLISNSDSAILLANQALQIAQQEHIELDQGLSYKCLGNIYTQEGQYDTARIFYNKALKLLEDVKVKEEIANTYIKIGITLSRQGKYEAAKKKHQFALEYSRENDDVVNTATALNSLGIVYSNQDDYIKALEYYLEGLKLREKQNDKEGIAISLTNVGTIYRKSGDNKKAIEYYEKALAISEEIEDKQGMISALLNLGVVYKKEEKRGKAIELYKEALSLAKDFGDKEDLGKVYNNLGSLYAALKDYDQAIENYQQSLKYKEIGGNQSGISTTLRNLSISQRKKGDFEGAINSLEKALVISKELKKKKAIANTYKSFSTTYKAQENYEKALENYELYQSYKDSLAQASSEKSLIELKTKYETEKNQRELLEREKKLTKQQEKINNLYVLIGGLVVLGLILLTRSFHKRYTLEKRTSEKLEELHAFSRSYAEATLESTADGILVVNSEGKIIRFNKQFVQLWKIPSEILDTKDDEQALGYAISQLRKPEQFIAKVKELYETPEAVSFDTLEFLDGRVFERYSQPHKVDEQIVGRVWSFRDVTDSRKAASKLKAQHLYLKTIIDLCPNFIFAKDRNGVFTLANTAVANVYGVTPEELVGKTDADFNPNEEEVKHFIEKDNEVIDSKKSIQLYEEITDSNGENQWLLTSKTPFVEVNGEFQQVLGVSTIITERVKAEETLKKNEVRIKKLLGEVQEKNDALEEQSQILKQINENLSRSNKELEQFAYVASHDLQEPLRMVGNFVQLLEEEYEEELNTEQRQYIEFIVDGVTRMSLLIDDLLNYSRVGRTEFKLREINISNLINKKLLDLSVKIKERNAKVIINDMPTKIKCEPNLLGITFYNLINNGIKFNQSEEPTITIDYEEKEKEHLFIISDNGIGIDKRNHEKIFQIFKRLHRKENFKGTGIGLALVKRIVLRHGGNIWLESELGKGSQFYLTLPK